MLRFSGKTAAATLLAAAIALTVSACSSSSSHPAAAPTSATTSTPAAPSSSPGSGATTGATTGAPAGASQVAISNFAFSPANLSVSAGQKITVINDDTVTHTLTATANKAFDTGDIAPGKTATFTAPMTPGTYPYVCTIHPFMHGTLTVQ